MKVPTKAEFDQLNLSQNALDPEKMAKVKALLERGHEHGHEHHHHHESIWKQLFNWNTLVPIIIGLFVFPVYNHIGIHGSFALLCVLGLYFLGFFHSIYNFVRDWTVGWRARRLIQKEVKDTIGEVLDVSTRLWKLGMMLPKTNLDRDIYLCIASLMHLDGFGLFTDYITKQWVKSKDVGENPKWILDQANALGELAKESRSTTRLFSLVVSVNAKLYPYTSPLFEFKVETDKGEEPRLDGVERLSKEEMDKLRKTMHEYANSCVYAVEAFLDYEQVEGEKSGFRADSRAEMCARAALALWNEYSVHLGGGSGKARRSVLPDVKEWLDQAFHYYPNNSLACLIGARVAEVSATPEKAITMYWKWLQTQPPDSREYPAVCYQTASLIYRVALKKENGDISDDTVQQIAELYRAGTESEELSNKLWISLNRSRFISGTVKNTVKDITEKHGVK